MKSYLIYLIRNGQTNENLQGKYIGHTDVPLCDEGLKALDILAQECEYPQPQAVFTSPLSRCTMTAEKLYPDITPIVLDGLIEYNFGEFEGKTAQELENHPVFPSWLAGEQGVSPPFGESSEQFQRRVLDCFCMIVKGLMKTGTTSAAVVTHGGVIMTVLAAFGLPQAPMHEWITENGCGYTVRISPSIWMTGQRFEVEQQLPIIPGSFSEPDIFENFNVEDYLYD